jgi:hypothetical protein
MLSRELHAPSRIEVYLGQGESGERPYTVRGMTCSSQGRERRRHVIFFKCEHFGESLICKEEEGELRAAFGDLHVSTS